MPDALRLITSPLPVAAGLAATHLSAAVGADALARRAWTAGRPATFTVEALAGDLGGRLALDRELVRQGHDRTTLTPAELDEAARAFEVSRRDAAAAQLAEVNVAADFDEQSALVIERAAEVAFVRLHDEGLIRCAQVVVPWCPSCGTVIEGPDAVSGELEGEALHLRLEGESALQVVVIAPELIDGAVGIGVPVGHPATGGRVRLPLVDRDVPVLAEPGCVEARLLVPAHDVTALEFSQLHGLAPRRVMSGDGVVLGDGPIGGLSRFAARQAARALLDAEGAILESTPGIEAVDRCRHCGSVAVPVLDWHWMLDISNIELAAADVVRHGSMAFVPSDVRGAVLELAGGSPWCLDRSVPGAVRLPVGTCNDCGRTTVAVTSAISSGCGKCFGEIEMSNRTVDARFTAALWPLVRIGWPGRISAHQVEAAAATVAVVAPDALETWALPALTLGFHLAGVVPFSMVVVQPPVAPDPMAGDLRLDEVDDARIARLALLAPLDPEAAASAVAALDAADGDDDVSFMAAVEAALAALDDGGPARAASLLASALMGGVPPQSADRVRALAVPLLGA